MRKNCVNKNNAIKLDVIEIKNEKYNLKQFMTM